jgi:hypothetical protein
MQREYQPAKILTYKTVADLVGAFPETQEHYEKNGVILLEDCGIEFDEAFIAATAFPPNWKKIGTVNGITLSPIVFSDGTFHRTQNPLCAFIKDDASLLKLYSELLRLELGFKLLVREALPAFRNIKWYNCTFRFTKTENEPPHLDFFGGGAPFAPKDRLRRLKFFLNVDTRPRVWNVGPTLQDLLAFSKVALARPLPDDLNVLCARLYEAGALNDTPMVRVEIPPRGVVFANGSTVVHQIVFGNRMVGLEGAVRLGGGALSAASEWEDVKRWIAGAG